MTVRRTLRWVSQAEEFNFLLTNQIPRRLATRFMGWFARIEQPIVSRVSIATWKLFCDVDLTDARADEFRSLHACFVRELRDGARPVASDPAILASPSDAIVGACGRIEGDQLYQVKGLPYRLAELIGEEDEAELYRDGCYATLRLTAGMYHHFHAPHDLVVEAVRYIHGDTWNVNPVALKRVQKLFCRNERAPIRTRLAGTGHRLMLVPVAAILVAGIRLPFLGGTLRGRTRTIPCRATFAKGERMGWFEHGSTIIALAPRGFSLEKSVHSGRRLRAGEPLFRSPLANGGGRHTLAPVEEPIVQDDQEKRGPLTSEELERDRDLAGTDAVLRQRDATAHTLPASESEEMQGPVENKGPGAVSGTILPPD